MSPKLIIAFDHLSQADFLAKAELIQTSLTNNPNFPTPWPAQVAAPADLASAFADYQAKAFAAESGDNVKIAGRNAARADLISKLKKLAPYLEVIADGNIAALESTGYDLRRDNERSGAATGTLAAPANLRLERGALSGVMTIRTRALKGAGSYEVQTATADPSVEGNWKAALVSKAATRIDLPGLTPGTIYHVRVRGIGARGPGAWAQSPGVMAV